MLLDYETLFEEDQAERTAATFYSANYIDMEVVGDAVDQLRALCQFTETCTIEEGGPATTVRIILESDDVNTFDSALTTHLDSGVLALATCVKGYKPWGAGARIPGGMKRYVRTKTVIGVGPLTTGAWTTALVTGLQNNTL